MLLVQEVLPRGPREEWPSLPQDSGGPPVEGPGAGGGPEPAGQ